MGLTPSPRMRRRRRLMFPILLILVGILFLLDQLVPGWGINKTWPAVLVVIGVIQLLDMAQPPRPPEGPRI